MAETPPDKVAILLPAQLVAQMDELKRYLDEDRDKPIEKVVLEMCESYVRVREMRRWELEHKEELDESYRQNPNLWDDADEWAALYPPEQDEKS
jgi:hypothetical protein